MTILEQSDTRLVVRASTKPLRVVAGLFAGLAAVTVALVALGKAPSEFAIMAVMSAAAVSTMFFFVPDTTIAMDSQAGTATITRRTPRGATTDLVELRRLQDVAVEQTQGQRGGAMFRISFVLQDGARLPWTSYFASSSANQIAIAAAARALLPDQPRDTATGAARPLVVGPPPGASRPQSLVPIGLFCLLFAGAGLALALSEQYKLSHYRPMTVDVVSVSVGSVRGSKGGQTYKPLVTYHYEVGGRNYEADQVTPLNESSSGRWAASIAGRYTPGARATGYYDPDDPYKAYLVHEHSWWIYTFLLLPAVLFTLVAKSRQRRARAQALASVAAPEAPRAA